MSPASYLTAPPRGGPTSLAPSPGFGRPRAVYRRPVAAIDGSRTRARNVRILAAGGTISMTGDVGAKPELDARALLETIPSLADYEGLEAHTISNLPSVHLSLADQLEICRQARDAARRGLGVVVTHGTDTLEETAMLCDVLHDAEAPIVFTGAIRPASAPGADGPANCVDAVSVAASEAAAGMGVLVCFGGEIHRTRGAQDRHDLARRLLLAPDRAARQGDRSAPDDLVPDPAQPAARPAAPRLPRAGRPDACRRRRHPRPRRARHRPRGCRDRHARRRTPRPRGARTLGRGRRPDPGRRLLPFGARCHPQRYVR